MNIHNYTRVLTHIQAHPETHNQGTWHCGTTHCFAGHSQIMAGHAQNDATCRVQAIDWLGLEGWQADYLFDSTRTLEQFAAWAAMTPEQQVMEAILDNVPVLSYLTDSQCTPEVCIAAVTQDGYAVRYLTDSQRTPEVCLAVVTQNGYAIKYLTDSQCTPEVCLAAVAKYGYAIKHLTDSQRTPEVCIAAVTADVDAIYCLTNSQRAYLTTKG